MKNNRYVNTLLCALVFFIPRAAAASKTSGLVLGVLVFLIGLGNVVQNNLPERRVKKAEKIGFTLIGILTMIVSAVQVFTLYYFYFRV